MNHYTYDEIQTGHTESFCVTITGEMMDAYRRITGDINPLHGDAAFAHRKGYPDRICFGMLTASFLSTMAGVYLPGEHSLIQRVETAFSTPVLVGDTLCITAKVQKKMDPFRTIVLNVSFTNQDALEVCRAKMWVGVLDKQKEDSLNGHIE